MLRIENFIEHGANYQCTEAQKKIPMHYSLFKEFLLKAFSYAQKHVSYRKECENHSYFSFRVTQKQSDVLETKMKIARH